MLRRRLPAFWRIFLPDGIKVTEDGGVSYVTGPDQFPTPPTAPPADPTAGPEQPWVSFGLLGAFQSVATQVEGEVTRFYGGALGYRQQRKNTTTGKRMTFTTPDMSPEWFQLSFALGAPPSNGEESTTVGHGGDNKIEGYLHFWYQNDVGTIYLVGNGRMAPCASCRIPNTPRRLLHPSSSSRWIIAASTSSRPPMCRTWRPLRHPNQSTQGRICAPQPVFIIPGSRQAHMIYGQSQGSTSPS